MSKVLPDHQDSHRAQANRGQSQGSGEKKKGHRRHYSARLAKGSNRKLILYIDGAARGNPGHAGIGGIISNEKGKVLQNISEYIGEATNNIAEYSALIFALQSIPRFEADEVKIYSDSELLVHQLNGDYKVKNQNLRVYFAWAKSLFMSLRKVEICHIDREQNAEADRLANDAIDRFLGGEKKPLTLEGFPEQQQLF